MDESFKICKNCKHFRRDFPLFLSARFAKCVAPQQGRNFVTGKPEWSFAHLLRLSSGRCGYEADWYEPK